MRVKGLRQKIQVGRIEIPKIPIPALLESICNVKFTGEVTSPLERVRSELFSDYFIVFAERENPTSVSKPQ